MTPSSNCPTCGVPLEPNGACLACLLGDALTADEVPQEEIIDSAGGLAPTGFGHFAPPEAGEFGKYTLRRKLGQGGMGIIWEAEDTSLQRVVALKMIRGFAFSTDSERQRFQTEATAVAQLDHPNIVPVHEVGEIEDQPYFSMKLLQGGTLAMRLKAGALEFQEAAAMMEKLARAIHHAHERGVLHRDLKPDNVLFDQVGNPYLTDFGLAKLLDASTGLTLTHAQIGTPQYMSPEQARGRASDITAASDVWAAGVLFYHMLTGRVPFPGTSSGEVLDCVSNENPLPMEHSSEGQIDDQLETLCLHCLQKDPVQRLPSAEFLANELGRWLRGEPIHTKPLQPRPAKRKWWRGAAVGVMACILAVAVLIAANRRDPQTPEPDPAGGGVPTPSGGIEFTQSSRVDQVILDATEGIAQTGVWIVPRDKIKFRVEGSYTYGMDPKIWSSAGDQESDSSEGNFKFPNLTPWALVGLVRSEQGAKHPFPVTDEVDYSGEVAGELSVAINTPVGEAGSAGGFVIYVDVIRQTRIFTAESEAAEAWGAPMLNSADSRLGLGLRMTVNGEATFSEDGQSVPADDNNRLLAPQLAQHQVIAKIGQAEAFALKPGFQRFGHRHPGWLRVSVNDEIARPGAYADNGGALQVSAQVFRPYRNFARQIALGEVRLRPLSSGGENSETLSFYVPTETLEKVSTSRERPPVFLRSEPAPGLTRIVVTAIRADADTYAFVVEDYPVAPGFDPTRHLAYLIIEDEGNMQVSWGGALYDRALFHRREPLAKESGTGDAFSLKSTFKPYRDPNMPAWPETLYLMLDQDGRLRPGVPDSSQAFNRAATWTLEFDED